MDSTVLHEYAETNRTSGGEKRDGSGGRVSLSGPSVKITHLTQVGVISQPAWKRPKDDTHEPGWTPDAHGFPHLGSLTPAEKESLRSCSAGPCSGYGGHKFKLGPSGAPGG